jgi:tRNA(adenine34) deaminase
MKNMRRKFIISAGTASAMATGLFIATTEKAHAGNTPNVINSNTLTVAEREQHEQFMRMAIQETEKIKRYPFGAVIVDTETGALLASGCNASRKNPTLHAEIVAMNNYVEKYGNQNWHKVTLYTTGEPCPMCMSALVWANVNRIVWGSSVSHIRKSGIPQFDLSAEQVAVSATSFYQPLRLIGGVLATETDQLFMQRLNHKN